MHNRLHVYTLNVQIMYMQLYMCTCTCMYIDLYFQKCNCSIVNNKYSISINSTQPHCDMYVRANKCNYAYFQLYPFRKNIRTVQPSTHIRVFDARQRDDAARPSRATEVTPYMRFSSDKRSGASHLLTCFMFFHEKSPLHAQIRLKI